MKVNLRVGCLGWLGWWLVTLASNSTTESRKQRASLLLLLRWAKARALAEIVLLFKFIEHLMHRGENLGLEVHKARHALGAGVQDRRVAGVAEQGLSRAVSLLVVEAALVRKLPEAVVRAEAVLVLDDATLVVHPDHVLVLRHMVADDEAGVLKEVHLLLDAALVVPGHLPGLHLPAALLQGLLELQLHLQVVEPAGAVHLLHDQRVTLRLELALVPGELEHLLAQLLGRDGLGEILLLLARLLRVVTIMQDAGEAHLVQREVLAEELLHVAGVAVLGRDGVHHLEVPGGALVAEGLEAEDLWEEHRGERSRELLRGGGVLDEVLTL